MIPYECKACGKKSQKFDAWKSYIEGKLVTIWLCDECTRKILHSPKGFSFSIRERRMKIKDFEDHTPIHCNNPYSIGIDLASGEDYTAASINYPCPKCQKLNFLSVVLDNVVNTKCWNCGNKITLALGENEFRVISDGIITSFIYRIPREAKKIIRRAVKFSGRIGRWFE